MDFNIEHLISIKILIKVLKRFHAFLTDMSGGRKKKDKKKNKNKKNKNKKHNRDSHILNANQTTTTDSSYDPYDQFDEGPAGSRSVSRSTTAI